MYEEAFEPNDVKVWSGAMHMSTELKKAVDKKR